MQITQSFGTPVNETENRLDFVLGEAMHDEIVWALRPTIRTAFQKKLDSQWAPGQARFAQKARALKSRLSGDMKCRNSVADWGPMFQNGDGALRLWNTENQRLAIGASLKASFALPLSPHPATVSKNTMDGLERLFSEFSESKNAICKRLQAAAHIGNCIEKLLDDYQPRVVVLGSTEHAYLRLLVNRARIRGIPSVYVPHAPAATNRIYADLPADFCLLGYQGDADYYATLGIKSEQCEVIGDPLAAPRGPLDDPAGETTSDHGVLLFSTGADRPASQLQDALEAVSGAAHRLGLDLLVAPHPRDREAAIRATRRLALPLYQGRTVEVFTTHRVVAQVSEHNSGALLYGIQQGIPVFRWTGPANYVFEEACRVQSLEEQPSQLLRLLGRSLPHGRLRAVPPSEWSSVPGQQAAKAREEFIGRSLSCIGPALDSWSFFDKRQT